MKALLHSIPPLAAAMLLVCAAPLGAAQRRVSRDAGGVSLLLEVKGEGARASYAAERTAVVIRRRCARLGVRCELSARPGGVANRLALRFSHARDAGRVKNVLLSKGFELRAVVSPPSPFPMLEYATRAEAEADAVGGAEALPLRGRDGQETYVLTERPPIITGDDLRSPSVTRAPVDDPGGGHAVECLLRPEGSARLRRWTRAHLNRYVAVVYDGRAVSTPYIRAPIWYNIIVSGGFDRRQAEDVAAVLAGGALPAPVEVLEETAHAP